MKCTYCLIVLLEHSLELKGNRVDVFRAKDAITMIAGDACCEDHLLEAIIKAKNSAKEC